MYLTQATTNINVPMKCLPQFSLQDYKQKSTDFLYYYWMSFSNFIQFALFITWTQSYICDRQCCLVLHFIFCISIICCTFYEIQRFQEQQKAINTKSIVLINCRKINHQQKNIFIIHKQLNGPVLKSLKPKQPGPKFYILFSEGRSLKF